MNVQSSPSEAVSARCPPSTRSASSLFEVLEPHSRSPTCGELPLALDVALPSARSGPFRILQSCGEGAGHFLATTPPAKLSLLEAFLERIHCQSSLCMTPAGHGAPHHSNRFICRNRALPVRTDRTTGLRSGLRGSPNGGAVPFRRYIAWLCLWRRKNSSDYYDSCFC